MYFRYLICSYFFACGEIRRIAIFMEFILIVPDVVQDQELVVVIIKKLDEALISVGITGIIAYQKFECLEATDLITFVKAVEQETGRTEDLDSVRKRSRHFSRTRNSIDPPFDEVNRESGIDDYKGHQ